MKHRSMVLAYKTDHETGVLEYMRLLTPDEFRAFERLHPNCSWRAYKPEGCRGPSDADFKNEVDDYGLEAAILTTVMLHSSSVDVGVLNKLNVDLRRFRIDGHNLEDGGYYGETHKQMLSEAAYVV